MPRVHVAPALVAASAVLFSSAAIYNGFPLVFDDTATHIADAFSRPPHWARSVVYSVFIAALHLQRTLWPVVIVQGLIAAHIVYLTLRVVLGRVEPAPFLLVSGALAATTSLPWFVGQIMPDVFTAVVILGLFLLGFGLDRLTRAEAVYLVLLTATAIASHLSHLPLALGLVAIVLAVKAVPSWREALRPTGLAAPLVSIVLAVAALVGSNIVYRGMPAISPYGQTFLLARAIADGPGKAYLRETCPAGGFALCRHLDELPSRADAFLWRGSSPLHKAGGAEALRAEAAAIVWGSWPSYPLWHLHWAFRHTLSQLARFETRDALDPYVESRTDRGPHRVAIAVRQYLPAVYGDYRASRQNTDRLSLDALRRLHAITAVVASGAAVFLVVVVGRRGDRLLLALALMIGAGLVGNAAISGALSGPHDRYQSRVIWLVVFYLLLGCWSLVKARVPAPADIPDAETSCQRSTADRRAAVIR